MIYLILSDIVLQLGMGRKGFYVLLLEGVFRHGIHFPGYTPDFLSRIRW